MSGVNLNSENNQLSDEKSINLREIIEKYIYHWRWFVLSLLVSLGLAFLYLRYSIPLYESKASVLIKDEKGGSGFSEMALFKDIGLLGGGSVIENEIEIFKSRTIIETAVKNLELNKEIIALGKRTGFKSTEFYLDAPFSISSVKNDTLLHSKEISFELTILNKKNYLLSNAKGEELGVFQFEMPVNTKIGKIVFNKSKIYFSKWIGRSFIVNIIPVEKVVTNIQKELVAETVNKDANVILLKIKGKVKEKNNALLNELIHQHEIRAIDDKNEIARNTTKFINDRMKFITVDLSDVEEQGQEFKSQHQLVDVTSDAALYLTKESAAEQAITDATIQLNLANYMNDYIRENQDNEALLPANLGFEDKSVVEMTNQYNVQVLERNRLLKSSGDKNPAVQRIDGQLVSLKASIVESLRNLKSSLKLQLNTLNAQENLYKSKIASVPKYEKEYRNILRQQQIKETLYIYLLQKREENEIALAAAVGNAKVIDYSYCDGEPVSPKKKIIFLGAFLLALIIPTGWIYIWELLDSKVHDSKDIDELNLPLVGELPINEEKEKIIAFRNSKSIISEAFRLVRSNISFIINGEAGKCKTILITSTIAGEGKSFVSLNLGHIYSNSGKKTVVIGMDLRIPTLDKYANISGNAGVSDFIVNESLELDDILIQDDNDENLFYILSGTIPPNPSELLMRDRMSVLFNLVKERFDYVIVDTAPLGLVSDTLLVSGFADLVIYVVRANFVDKRNLYLPQKLLKENKLGTMAVLLNGVNLKGKGYGYGYGYGVYGVQSKKPKKWFFKRN
jgi:capsular exopolysaccharide synthesis family protein